MFAVSEHRYEEPIMQPALRFLLHRQHFDTLIDVLSSHILKDQVWEHCILVTPTSFLHLTPVQEDWLFCVGTIAQKYKACSGIITKWIQQKEEPKREFLLLTDFFFDMALEGVSPRVVFLEVIRDPSNNTIRDVVQRDAEYAKSIDSMSELITMLRGEAQQVYFKTDSIVLLNDRISLN